MRPRCFRVLIILPFVSVAAVLGRLNSQPETGHGISLRPGHSSPVPAIQSYSVAFLIFRTGIDSRCESYRRIFGVVPET